jgi:outer membrane murein-binding lipoprotein Lpp
MRRWSRWAAVCIAAGMALAVTGCGQLFQQTGATSQPTLAELAQRVDQLEAQVSELNAAVAGMGQGGRAATSSAAAGSAQAVVTASYLNVHPQPDVNSPRVGVLRHDTQVSVLATQGSWTKIGYQSLQGWVESQWLAKPGTEPGPSATGSTAAGIGNGGNSTAPTAGPSPMRTGGNSTGSPTGSGSGASSATSGGVSDSTAG